jgi:hypothetical protein
MNLKVRRTTILVDRLFGEEQRGSKVIRPFVP